MPPAPKCGRTGLTRPNEDRIQVPFPPDETRGHRSRRRTTSLNRESCKLAVKSRQSISERFFRRTRWIEKIFAVRARRCRQYGESIQEARLFSSHSRQTGRNMKIMLKMTQAGNGAFTERRQRTR